MNFGVGVYFLILLWSITLILCWVSVRTGHGIGKISILISVIITLALILLPTKGQYSNANFYDQLFVIRYLILLFLSISFVVGLVYSFVYVCLAPHETIKVRRLGAIY